MNIKSFTLFIVGLMMHIQLGYSQEITHLEKSKFWLLNGDVYRSKLFAQKAIFSEAKNIETSQYYLALNYFIQKDFANSLKHLEHPSLNQLNFFKHICVIKVISLIALRQIDKIGSEWNRCKIENNQSEAASEIDWVDIFVRLTTYPNHQNLKKIFNPTYARYLGDEQTKSLLKLALFLNFEKEILDKIELYQIENTEDEELKEIIGFMYYRQGKLVKAYQYLHDLSSPNGLQFKGQIFALQEKWELSYLEYQELLKIKLNSGEALKKLIPLSWILSLSEDGLKYLDMNQKLNPDQLDLKLIKTAFYLNQKKFIEADKVIQYLSKFQIPKHKWQLHQYELAINLSLHKILNSKIHANELCLLNDVIGCWTLMQLENFQGLSYALKNDEKIHPTVDIAFNHEAKKIKEKVYINQKDIEELDERDVNALK